MEMCDINVLNILVEIVEAAYSTSNQWPRIRLTIDAMGIVNKLKRTSTKSLSDSAKTTFSLVLVCQELQNNTTHLFFGHEFNIAKSEKLHEKKFIND